MFNSCGESSSLPPPLLYLFCSCGYFVKFAFHIRCRQIDSIILRRISTVSGRFHQSALHPVNVFFRLSNQRFVRSAHAHKFACRFATAVNNGYAVCLAQRKPNASPCIYFFSACQIKDLSAPLTFINSLAASKRRLTTVTGANSTFTPFTLLMFFYPSE